MATYSDGVRKEQEGQFAGSLLGADPLGNIIYVDSANGNDGRNGHSPRAALKTLTQAVALASAGDTIIVDKGGSETVTAAISVSVARLKIICKTDNNRSGFTVTGAGTLDLISVTGTDCHIEGLQFAHTGATANASGILASAAAHRLTVKKCLFDDSAIVTTFTGVGVEVTAGADDSLVEDCLFLDTKYGVQIVASGTNVTNRPKIKDCEFFVGRANFFGLYAAAGTGSVQSPRVDGCKFHEAIGDGAVATGAWDGTDGTNGSQGPISFGANVDQYRVYDCVAYTASAVSFDLLNAVNAGATGDMIGNSSGEGGDLEDKVDLINPNTATKCTSSEVVINANTATKVTSGETVINANTATKVTSGEVVIAGKCTSSEVVINANTATKVTSGETVINANTATKVTSGETVINANTATKCTSSEVVVAAACTSSEVVVNANTATKVTSGEVVINANTDAKVTSGEVVVAGKCTSSEVVVNANTDAKVTSGETVINAATTAACTSSEVVINAATTGYVNAKGRPVGLTQVIADNTVPNNVQTKAIATATGGDVWIEEIILSKDGTLFAGPLNIEITCDNAYGPTGAASNLMANVIAGLGANLSLRASQGGITPFVPMMLESTKKLYIQGSDATGSSAGNIKITVKGYAMSDGAYLA